MKRQIVIILVAELLGAIGCQVQNGVLCSYLNDHCGEDAGAEEGGDTGEPQSFGDHPCDQIGAAVGLPLVPLSDPAAYPAWSGGSPAVMWWDDTFPAGWRWLGSVPAPGATGELRSVADAFGDAHWLVVSSLSTSGDYRWIQARDANWIRYGALDAGQIVQADDSVIAYVATDGAGAQGDYWNLQAYTPEAYVRGWVTDGASADAGPSQSNIESALANTRGFRPAEGTCVVGPAEAADDTGAEPGGIYDPCAVIEAAIGTPLEPAPSFYSEIFGSSLAWEGEPEAVMRWSEAADSWVWDGPAPMAGARAALDSGTNELVFHNVARPAEGSQATHAWIVTEGDVLVPTAALRTVEATADAEAIQHGGATVWVAALADLGEDHGHSLDWRVLGGLDARGLASAAGGQFGSPAVDEVGGLLDDADRSFYPAIGYCRPYGAGMAGVGGSGEVGEASTGDGSTGEIGTTGVLDGTGG